MISQRVRPWTAWLALGVILLLGGCATSGEKKEVADSAYLKLYKVLSPEELARLTPPEQIRYFTDNLYLATVSSNTARADAADAAWRHLAATLSKEDFVQFWQGVDTEFFGRINAALDHPDYTSRQVPFDQRRLRTAYTLGARHMQALKSLGEARQQAMRYLIELAAKGDSAACFTFHKAYKNYPKPRAGDAKLTWLKADGKPFRKSMWEGSAEAVIDGRVVQIPVPAEVVLGCRTLLQPPAAVTAGQTHEVEQYFSEIQLKDEFDSAAYDRHKAAWLQDLKRRAMEASERLRLERIRIVNVVDVYRIFPPELDYQYELALSSGGLSELVAAGLLNEQDAFVVEQRVEERKILLTGVGVTPQNTPMAFLQMVAERAAPKK